MSSKYKKKPSICQAEEVLRRRYIRITDPRTVWFLCQGDPSAAVELATCRPDWASNQNLRIDVAFHNRVDRQIRATSVVKDGAASTY